MKNILKAFAVTLVVLAIIASCPNRAVSNNPASNQQPTTAPGFQSQLHVTEQVLCQLENGVVTSAVSPGNMHFAYACRKGEKKVVVLDGVPGPEFDDIDNRGNGPYGSSLQFSEDEVHLAYPAKRGNKWLVVKDGIAGDEYDQVVRESLHFDDKGKLVFTARTAGSQFRVVDGKATLISTQISASNHVERNGHIAYVLSGQVFLDGKPGPKFDEVYDLRFSDSGNILGYIARSNNQEFVIVGDKKFGPVNNAWVQVWDDGSFIYTECNNEKWTVNTNGKEGPRYDNIKDRLLLQINEGKPLFYAVQRGEQWFAVVNDNPLGPYDELNDSDATTDDGKHVACAARKGSSWHMIVDGKAGEGFEDMGAPKFTPDGKHLVYGVSQGRIGRLMVDGKPRGQWEACPKNCGLSGDGRHVWAYGATKDRKYLVLADDRREGPFDAVVFCDSPKDPGPEGHFGYLAALGMPHYNHHGEMIDDDPARESLQIVTGGKWFVVVDGLAGPLFDGLLLTHSVFGKDGKIRYLAVRDNKVIRVTMDLPSTGANPPVSAIPTAEDVAKLMPAPPVKEYQNTVVAPNLQQPIIKDKNALWCASFQLAWNELMDFSGGPIVVKDSPSMVDALNQRIISRSDMDPASVVAVAGTVESGVIEKARAEVLKKFPNASADMLPSTEGLGPKFVVAYAYFRKQLPFELAFDRNSGMRFGSPPAEGAKDTRPKVDWFGLGGINAKRPEQVRIIWHKFGKKASADSQPTQEFIVELLTKAKNDRLILARIDPGKDLLETTRRVLEHLAKPNTAGPEAEEAAGAAMTKIQEAAKPDESQEEREKRSEKAYLAYSDKISQASCLLGEEGLEVPVIELDLAKEFTDLYGRAIASKNPKLDGQPIVRASQKIRFKLDETGADLESSAQSSVGGAPARNFIFDQPFLVLLIQKGAKQPYFALWIGNAELLVRSGR